MIKYWVQFDGKCGTTMITIGLSKEMQFYTRYDLPFMIVAWYAPDFDAIIVH